MDVLSSGPPEIICCIFRSCEDFPQVLALASACKHLHSVWIGSSSSIITKDLVSSMNVLSFEDALMAVRATNVVLNGYPATQSFPFKELSSTFKLPTLEELKGVLDFRHLVRCSEYMVLHGTKYGHHSELGAIWMEGSSEEEMIEFRERFHRALFRVFLAGAVLHRAFNEPFDVARRKPNQEAFLNFSAGESYLEVERGCSRIHYRHPTLPDYVDYLREFAVYNFDAVDDSEVGRWRDAMYEPLFGPLSKYIVDDGEARGIQKAKEFEVIRHQFEEGEVYDSPLGPGVEGSAKEIMLLIGAYEQLLPNIMNADGSRIQEREQFPCAEFGVEKTRTVTVVIFGIFTLEEICMPSVVEESKTSILLARPHQTRSLEEHRNSDVAGKLGEELHTLVNIPCVMKRLRLASKRPNRHDHYPVPPPAYQPFLFAARKYLGLGFHPSFFAERADSDYVEQIEWGYVFLEIKEQPLIEYHPPVCTYEPPH